MDRSDPVATVGPPTGKTEPAKPASASGREPDGAPNGEGEPRAVPETEQQDKQPDVPSEEAEETARPTPEWEQASERPQAGSGETEAAAGSAAEPEQATTPAAPSGEAEATASSPPDAEQVGAEGESAGPAFLPVEALEDRQHARPSDRRPLLDNWDRDQAKAVCVRGAKVAAIVFSAWFTVVIFLIVIYRVVNPPVSSLMVLKWLGGARIQQEWVPLERISPNLMRAVIASEDGRFCQHWGIDYGEVLEAIKRTSHGVPRGASTLTMQVAKNLFLWPAKSYVRKIIEVPLTYAIELFWPKRRILEVYLNIAEWGPGIFGAEAAARAHFHRSASRLSRRQAAQMAVSLPNPMIRNASHPGPWASRRASIIQRRAARGRSMASCVVSNN